MSELENPANETRSSEEGTERKVPELPDFGKLIEQKLSAMLPKVLETSVFPMFQKEIAEKLSQLKPEKEQEKTKNSGDVGNSSSELIQLRSQIEKMNKERAAEKQVLLQEKTYNRIQKTLAGKIVPESESMVINYLMKAKNSLKFDGDSVSFLFDDAQYSLEDGVNEWLKTSEAKIFTPSPTPKGVRSPVTTSRSAVSDRQKVDFSKLSEAEKIEYAASVAFS